MMQDTQQMITDQKKMNVMLTDIMMMDFSLKTLIYEYLSVELCIFYFTDLLIKAKDYYQLIVTFQLILTKV